MPAVVCLYDYVHCQTLFCREAAHFFFYRVQLTDTFQGSSVVARSAYIDIEFFSGMAQSQFLSGRSLLHVPD